MRGIKVIPREEAIAAATRNYGYFALLSNEIKDPLRALQVYRNKDMVEKAFDNLKERLNLRLMAVSSEQSLDGKLFVRFIALIYVSYITQKMQHHHLLKQYTLQDVLDELDLIECFKASGQKLRFGETTKTTNGAVCQIRRYSANLVTIGLAEKTIDFYLRFMRS